MIAAQNALDAWLQVARLLHEGGPQRNLLVRFASAMEPPSSTSVVCPSRVDPGAPRIADVANTIFPNRLWHRSADRHDLYTRYLAVHRRGMRLSQNRSRWGTYFERLIAYRGCADQANPLNQLERLIEKLLTWRRVPSGALVVQVVSPVLDKPRPIGSPCWQMGELLLDGDLLHFVAIYRRHDYFSRALGNFVGLQRLLAFICHETGRRPGTITCHSVEAFASRSTGRLITFAEHVLKGGL